MTKNELNVKAMALSFGVLTSISMFFLAVITGYTSWGNQEVISIIASFYKGYSTTLSGAIKGAIWGLLDGGIGGALVALLYNYFSK